MAEKLLLITFEYLRGVAYLLASATKTELN